jgi:hypothetical protein
MKKQKTEFLDKFTDDEIKSLVIKMINSTPLAGVFSTSQKRRLARIAVNMVRKYGLDADLNKVKGEIQFGEMVVLDILLPKIFKSIKKEKKDGSNKEGQADDSKNRRRYKKEPSHSAEASVGQILG